MQVDVGFLAYLPIGPNNDLAAMPLAVRFDFANYDLWPPSLRVVDSITRRWLLQPRLGAFDFSVAAEDGAPVNLFVGGHPDTGRVFLCKRGVREYHTIPSIPAMIGCSIAIKVAGPSVGSATSSGR